MNNDTYFYLEGSEKKGPLSKEKIIELNLPKETLIFVNETNNWLPLSSLNEFNTEKNNTNKKIKIPKVIIFFLMLALSSTVAFYITEYNRKSDYKLLKDKINSVFGNKTQVSDYSKYSVKGQLEKAKYYDEIWGKLNTKKDNEDKELYEFFKPYSGGWTVYTLTDLNLGYKYRYEEHISTDMGFKVPEFTESGGEKISGTYPTLYYPIYKNPTYRGTVQEAYNESVKFLSVGKDKNSYVANSFNKINNFKYLSSKYYSISQSESWNGMGEGNVFNKNWIVWYKSKSKHFEIIRNTESYNNSLIINLLIGGVASILIYLIWKYGNRISFER